MLTPEQWLKETKGISGLYVNQLMRLYGEYVKVETLRVASEEATTKGLNFGAVDKQSILRLTDHPELIIK